MNWLRSRSIVVDQALVSTAVMLIAILLLGIAAIKTVSQQERTALSNTIDTDIAGLVDVLAQGGPAELARRINDRTAFAATGSPAAYYRLTNAKSGLLTGNLGRPPAVDASVSPLTAISVEGDDVLIRTTRLRGGYVLIVGRSLAPTTAVLDGLARLFLLAAIPAALLSFFTGPLLARRLQRRIASVNTTFAQFERGDLSARTAMSAGGEEIGKLAAYVDRHLANIEKLLKSQREITDNIAHELRTPLVHLDTRLLRALSASDEGPVSEELHDARADVRSIVSLFDTLLDLALAESRGGLGSNMVDFDLSECAADIAELYSASAEDHGLEFTTRLTPDVNMRGEAMSMARLIANLLDNAFKYVPSGGHVRLTVATGPRIVVDDDGPGIPNGLRDRVFQRFNQARTGGEGHGLGLALVRVIAARHGLIARYEDASPGARFIVEKEAAS